MHVFAHVGLYDAFYLANSVHNMSEKNVQLTSGSALHKIMKDTADMYNIKHYCTCLNVVYIHCSTSLATF